MRIYAHQIRSYVIAPFRNYKIFKYPTVHYTTVQIRLSPDFLILPNTPGQVSQMMSSSSSFNVKSSLKDVK